MEDNKVYYMVSYEGHESIEEINGEKEVRLYESVQSAVDMEFQLKSFRYMAPVLAIDAIENGTVVTPKDLYHGNSLIGGAAIAYNKLVLQRVEVSDESLVYDSENAGIMALELNENLTEQSEFSFNEVNNSGITLDVYKYSYTIEESFRKTSGSNIKSVDTVALSDFTLDEDVTDIFEVYHNALCQEVDCCFLNAIGK